MQIINNEENVILREREHVSVCGFRCKSCNIEECSWVVYHSNSLSGSQFQLQSRKTNNVPSTFGKEVISTIDVDHAIFQDTLPLVFDSCDLKLRIFRLRCLIHATDGKGIHLVVRAKHDIIFSRSPFFRLFLAFRG